MKNSLIKKVTMAVCSVLTLIMLLFVKVSATNTLVMGEDYTRETAAGSSSFFAFLSDAAQDNSFVLARVFMWAGFILVLLCTVYFIALLVLSLMGKDKLVTKLNLVTRIAQGVLVFALILILFAGLDEKSEDKFKDMGIVETLSISLFGVPFMLALVFGVSPIACEYLVKE